MRRACAAGGALLLALAMTACSGGDDGPPPSTDVIVVTNAPVNGTMKTGQELWLEAEVQDSAHQRIGCLYPLKWTNSNPAVLFTAEPYPGGLYVRAQSPGAAVLSVHCDALVTTVPVEVAD